MHASRSGAVLLCAALSLGGCGDDADGSREATPAVPQEEAAARAPAPEPLYGPGGELLGSGRRVAGLELPRGLEAEREERRRHVFRTRVPLTKVQRYFGTRLVTGQVDSIGDGAIYREATPQGVRGGVVKMDVSILPLGQGLARVEIVEILPPPPNPPPESQVLERYRRDSQMWD